MITPNEIRARMPHSVACEQLEKRLDAAISYAALMSQWPAKLGLRGEPSSAVDEVIAMYRRGGWDIKRVSATSSDLDYISIEAP